MDVHPGLTTFVYVALVVVALLVIAYWVTYTRRLKTPPHVGKNEGIAMATERRGRGLKGRIQ
jgi:membrane protein implicated in regulation of membrane protease activity